MRYRRILAAAALAGAAAAAHAEHFKFSVFLSGTYSQGGTEGCFPPYFDQPACTRPGSLSGTLSFDTPSSRDGSYLVENDFGDITNFLVTLGSLPTDSLLGGVNLQGGIPNGSVQSSDRSESFSFDWATQTAYYAYDFGYHEPNGSFSGMLAAVPEPAPSLFMLAALTALGGLGLRRTKRVQHR